MHVGRGSKTANSAEKINIDLLSFAENTGGRKKRTSDALDYSVDLLVITDIKTFAFMVSMVFFAPITVFFSTSYVNIVIKFS